MIDGKLQIHHSREKPEIVTSKRVGLSVGQDLELRFYIKENRFISKP
jgi:3-methyladenine DNA glycosylase Mpg